MKFMQQLLTGDKKSLQAKDVKGVNVPYFPEISVAKLLEKSKSDPRILEHLPDPTEKKKPNKEFVWHVIAHFQRDFIDQSITNALKLRSERMKADEKKRAKLVVDPKMLQRLAQLNLIRKVSFSTVNLTSIYAQAPV